MSNKWYETEFTNHFYYREETGLIIGLSHRLGTQGVIYLSKVYRNNQEMALGQYITIDHAKRAIENYWEIEDRTLLSNES